MTTKYESVLSNAEIRDAVKQIYGTVATVQEIRLSLLIEQATLAKLQPQLDAIGAGGVSGQRITKNTEEWSSSKDGKHMYSSDFVHDVMLKVCGDFESDSQRVEYSNILIVKLNAPIMHQVSLGGQPFRKQPEIRPTDDELWDQTISDRDHNEEQANKLANAIAKHFGAVIGEHTSANCPWRNALEVIENSEPRIPEGYKLVPIEPTKEMKRAGYENGADTQRMAGEHWKAMLAAAPTVKDPLTIENQELRIVFSGEMPNLTFVEVENEDGFSVNAGAWHKRFDGYTELRITAAK